MTKLVAIIAYWTGLDALFYWLNRKAKRIITFHNILRDEIWREGVANGVSNKLSDFERIVDECAKRFGFSTDLSDAKTLTITFDDGYRNQYTTAFRSLQKRAIPAYVFVSGDVRGGRYIIKVCVAQAFRMFGPFLRVIPKCRNVHNRLKGQYFNESTWKMLRIREL